MELRSVRFEYESGCPIIDGLDLSLPLGSRMAVMGESGRGKTTLVRLMLGLARPTSGVILFEENEKPAAVFQEDRLLPWLTALQNVAIVSDTETAHGMLELMELTDAKNKRPKELSGGMQRRVAIARALAFGGNVLVLDEPFKGLDRDLKARVAGRLSDHAAFSGATIVLITHDVTDAALCGCNEMLYM